MEPVVPAEVDMEAATEPPVSAASGGSAVVAPDVAKPQHLAALELHLKALKVDNPLHKLLAAGLLPRMFPRGTTPQGRRSHAFQ